MLGIAMLAALLLPAGGASGARQSALTRHVPAAVASGSVQRIGAAPANQIMEVTVSLPSRNEAELHSLLERMYDPASPLYRHFLSVAQFTDRYGPSETDYRSLLAFAGRHHLRSYAPVANRRVLDLRGSVADIDRAFGVDIGLYRRLEGSGVFFAPDREPALDVKAPRPQTPRWRRVRVREGTLRVAISGLHITAVRRSRGPANPSACWNTPGTTLPT
jgi:hypothetical protein